VGGVGLGGRESDLTIPECGLAIMRKGEHVLYLLISYFPIPRSLHEGIMALMHIASEKDSRISP
jgi:hypothetical protein